MTDPGYLRELPPVPWVRERDIDLLLAELLSTETELTEWLVNRSLQRPAERPDGAPASVRAIVNYSRPDALACGAGETDVVVEADYPSGAGTLLLSIEDKVWATPQRDQGGRHRLFVEGHSSRWGLAVLVAPRVWMVGHATESAEYHLCVALEDIAEWCRQRGFMFQSSVFRQACVPPRHELAPDLQDWHTAVDRLLDDEFGLRLAPQRFVRTKNMGQAKAERWASCEKVTLTAVRGADHPWLTLKPASVNHTARVAIELGKAPPDLADQLAIRATEFGFGARITRAGTLLIERSVPEAARWTVGAPFEQQTESLRAVGHAAVAVRDWWNALIPALSAT